MDLREELRGLPEKTQRMLNRGGVMVCFTAGQWLPDGISAMTPIRLIEEGEIEVVALLGSRISTIYTFGPGEMVGLRPLLRPLSTPPIAFFAKTNVRCLEFDATFVRQQLIPGCAILRQLLEHYAHMRDLDIMMAAHPLFGTLSQQHREKLLAASEPQLFLEGELLLGSGSIEAPLFLIIDGRVECYLDDEMHSEFGNGEVVGRFEAGGGEMRLLAKQVTKALQLPRSLLQELCGDHRELCQRIRRLLPS